MPDTFELTRFIIAFFASGIFWLMVLFYAEKRWREHGLPGAGIAAGIVLTAAGILFFKVVVDDAPWNTPPPMWPDETSYSAPVTPGVRSLVRTDSTALVVSDVGLVDGRK